MKSDRQQQILQGLADGLVKKEIADKLKISLNTVCSYMARIRKQTNISTSAGLVAWAFRKGIVR